MPALRGTARSTFSFKVNVSNDSGEDGLFNLAAHVPAGFRLAGDELQLIGPPRGERFRLAINDDGRYLVNCGSVGQPRDGDPRAAFGVLDTDEHAVTIHRVTYDMPAAQAKIIAAGLPEVLAQRLGMGR